VDDFAATVLSDPFPTNACPQSKEERIIYGEIELTCRERAGLLQVRHCHEQQLVLIVFAKLRDPFLSSTT
jgi:hypothetical protein